MRLTVELSLLRLASIFSRSPERLQRISVGWMVVRLPSLITFSLTRSSIELTLASPVGQPKAWPGITKPFSVVDQPASQDTRRAAIVHLILESPSVANSALTFPERRGVKMR